MSSTYGLSLGPILESVLVGNPTATEAGGLGCARRPVGQGIAQPGRPAPSSLRLLCSIVRYVKRQSGGHALGRGLAVIGIEALLLGHQRPSQVQQLARHRT